MARRTKYNPMPAPTVREGIRNIIKLSNHGYKPGEGFKTSLDTIFAFYTHNRTKEEVYEELSKWVNLEDLELDTDFVLPAEFFDWYLF